MRLTKKRAIELSIELWEWLAETGYDKSEWTGWVNSEYAHSPFHCFLCEYAMRKSGVTIFSFGCCSKCPYNAMYGWCAVDDSYYDRWESPIDESDRKKYAKLFLEQLKTLLEGEK